MHTTTNSFNGQPADTVYPSVVKQNENGTYIYTGGVAFWFYGVENEE